MYKGYKPLTGSAKIDSVIYTTGLNDVDGYFSLLMSRGVDILVSTVASISETLRVTCLMLLQEKLGNIDADVIQ